MRVVGFGSTPTPALPPPASKLDQRAATHRKTEKERRGRAWSQSIQPEESSALYKPFNTLGIYLYFNPSPPQRSECSSTDKLARSQIRQVVISSGWHTVMLYFSLSISVYQVIRALIMISPLQGQSCIRTAYAQRRHTYFPCKNLGAYKKQYSGPAVSE